VSIQEIRSTLTSRIPDLARRYHVRSLGLFGSRVRGDAGSDSDLDVLVEFETAPTFFQFVRLEDELSALAGVRVDLVVRDSLRPELADRILGEVVPCHA